MRDINASALAELSREFGLEPVNIVRVFWNDNPVDYSDKREGLEQFGVLGKVLEISGLDNVISIDKSSASASIQVKLDDSDGSLRTIINNMDIHKRPVQILQFFTGHPYSDAFILFAGQINTPMSWDEGERSLSFTIVSQVENLELGFSLEEGLFQEVPATAYGKAFPLVFGQVAKVPSLMMADSPGGILAEGFAYLFEDQYTSEISDLSAKASQAQTIATGLYSQMLGLEILAASYNDGDIGPSNPDDYGTYLKYHQASQQAYQQYVKYMEEVKTLGTQVQALEDDKREKEAYAKSVVTIATQNFPIGIPVVIEINNSRFNASFDGQVMTIGPLILPPNAPPSQNFFAKFTETDQHKQYTSEKTKEKFRWFDAGSKIRVISVPIYYAAAFGAGCQMLAVYAKKDGVRIQVPTNLYNVLRVPFASEDATQIATAVVIQMIQPLTTLYDLNAEQLYATDEIWCDIIGEVPGDYVSIMQYVIATFTTVAADPDTFGLVAAQTVFTPMNFAVVDRKNVIDFMKDISYQARVASWIDNGTVKLRYLAAPPNPVGTITPDDVMENTLSITCDDTERIVTKVTATWRPSMDQTDPNKIIIRTNVLKYGLKEETTDYYCYQFAELVRRSATYWSIREGNSWKLIKLKTHIGKLAFESQDAVLLSGFNGMFSNGDVVGIINSANFDSSSMTIDMEIWLPIRWGEMDPYLFAYPANVFEDYGLGAEEFMTGNPFSNVTDTAGVIHAAAHTFTNYHAPPFNSRPYPIGDTPVPLTFNTAISTGGLNYGRPLGLITANNRNDYELKPAADITVTDTTPSFDIGKVKAAYQDGFSYDVELFAEVKTKVVKARQLVIASGWTVVIGTPVYLVRKNGVYYMQAPTWAPETTDS